MLSRVLTAYGLTAADWQHPASINPTTWYLRYVRLRTATLAKAINSIAYASLSIPAEAPDGRIVLAALDQQLSPAALLAAPARQQAYADSRLYTLPSPGFRAVAVTGSDGTTTASPVTVTVNVATGTNRMSAIRYPYPAGVLYVNWTAAVAVGPGVTVNGFDVNPLPFGTDGDEIIVDTTTTPGTGQAQVRLTGTPITGDDTDAYGGIFSDGFGPAPAQSRLYPPPWVNLEHSTLDTNASAYATFVASQRQYAEIHLPMWGAGDDVLPQNVKGQGDRSGQLIPARVVQYRTGTGETPRLIPLNITLAGRRGDVPTARIEGVSIDQAPVTPTTPIPPAVPTMPTDPPVVVAGGLPAPTLTVAQPAVLATWPTSIAGEALGPVDLQRAAKPVPPVEPVWATIAAGQTDGRHTDRMPGFGTWLYRLFKTGTGGGPIAEVTLEPPATVASPRVVTTLTGVDVYGITRRAGRGYAILTNTLISGQPQASVRLLTPSGAFDGDPFQITSYGSVDNRLTTMFAYQFSTNPGVGFGDSFPDIGYSPTLRRLWIGDGLKGGTNFFGGLIPYNEDGTQITDLAQKRGGTRSQPYRVAAVSADDSRVSWLPYQNRNIASFDPTSTTTPVPAVAFAASALPRDIRRIGVFYWNVAAPGAQTDRRAVLVETTTGTPAITNQTAGTTVGPYQFPSFDLDVPDGAAIVGFDIDTSGYDEANNSGQMAVAAIRLANGQVRIVEWPLAL